MVEKKPYISPSAFDHFASHLQGSVKLFVVWKIMSLKKKRGCPYYLTEFVK